MKLKNLKLAEDLKQTEFHFNLDAYITSLATDRIGARMDVS